MTGQYRLDNCQQMMRYCHNRLVGVHATFQFFEVPFPMRIGFHRPPSYFHQRPLA